MAGPKKGITADRKSPEKISLIVENYESLTRDQLSSLIGESPRWVKRQIRLLKEKGLISNKRDPVNSYTWPEGSEKRAIFLRTEELKTAEEISAALSLEFDFSPPSYTIEHKFATLGIKFPTKEEWLHKKLPKELLAKLLDSGLRILDIKKYIIDNYKVSINEDLLLTYINKIGLQSQKNLTLSKIHEKMRSYSREELDNKFKGGLSVSGLSREIGLSKTVINKRIKKDKLIVVGDRKIWSKSLEYLRRYLLDVKPRALNISKEDKHQMVLGWLLGDGSLSKTGRLSINHSLKQLSYLYLKRMVLTDNFSSIFPVPASHFSGEGTYIGGEEQIGISCINFNTYLNYLNEDGSKNYEKIIMDLNDLGWACYFMDDGSYFNGKQIISMGKNQVSYFENKYRFRSKLEYTTALEVKGIDSKYIIPCMSAKVETESVGSYWENIFPELFKINIGCDFDLCFVNQYTVNKDDDVLKMATEYYLERGFPYFSINKDYLEKEFNKLALFNTSYIWKKPDLLQYINVGNRIFKNFMPHMVEATYRDTSPYKIFNNYMSLRSSLLYTLKIDKSILPDFLFSRLVYFNGGVSGFPCGVAKAVVERFSKEGDLVVDPCAGWGGRLLGTVSAKRKYIGFEPWDKTFKGLQDIIGHFSLHGEANIIMSAFDIGACPKKCNLIFTSPPYIDLEVYGTALTKKMWIKLINDIFKYAEYSLESKGYLVINLPRSLKTMLPNTSLSKKEPIFWFTSSRKKNRENAELLLVYQNT